MLISFSGLDGAGKGTQIEILSSFLRKKKYKVYYFWSRGGYTPGFELIKRVIRFILGRKLPKQGHSPSRSKQLANPFILRVWLYFALLDLIFYWVFYLRLKILMGYIVICDRYIEDTAIDFKLNFPEVRINNFFLWKLLKFFALKQDLKFLLLISVNESIKRSAKKNEPFPDSRSTLQARLRFYEDKTIFPDKKYHLINCEKSVMEISKIIIKSSISIIK